MDLDAWLARIRYDGPLSVDATTLAAVQRAHLLAVPFENLSIGWHEPIALDVAAHFDKIVRRRRGGFCYELNGLFAWALLTMGFPVRYLSAAVWSTRDGVAGYGRPAAHLFLRVDLDETWIADVGFGDNFRAPLRLVDGVVQDEAPRAFRLDRDADDLWTLQQRDHAGAWSNSYRFANVARPLAHFAAMCDWQQTAAESIFVQRRLCTLATPDGRVTLANDELIESRLDGWREVRAVDTSERAHLLSTRFGIARTPSIEETETP